MASNNTTPPQATSTQLITALMRRHEAGDLDYRGKRNGRYTVHLDGGRVRSGTAAEMLAWTQGYELGEETASTGRVPDAVAPAALRRVLVRPTLADACRLAIYAAMEAAGVGVTELARRADVTAKTVGDTLRFGTGRTISMTVAEKYMTCLGGVWDVGYIRADPPTGTDPVAPAFTDVAPTAIKRLRALALYHEAGLLQLVSPTSPTVGRRASTYAVERAGATHELSADTAVHWLVGLGDAVDPDIARTIEGILPTGV